MLLVSQHFSRTTSSHQQKTGVLLFLSVLLLSAQIRPPKLTGMIADLQQE